MLLPPFIALGWYLRTMNKLGFFFDGEKTGDWAWPAFLNGNVGMSGTDGQLLLLVSDLSKFYSVYFFTNVSGKEHHGFETVMVKDLADAAVKAKALLLDLVIFNNRNDTKTIEGIQKMAAVGLDFIMWDQNGPSPLFTDLLSTNKYLKRIVCVSRNHANSHRHKKFFPKVTYIYNGIRQTKEATKHHSGNSFNLAYIGAVGETKGFQWMAKAWPKVKEKFPSATLKVIGSIKTHDATRETGDLYIAETAFEHDFIKPYLGNTHEEIKANGVVFTGHVSPKEIDNVLTGVALGIVNPNTGNHGTETFCVSAVDFQAYGIPVIGGNAGGLKETVCHGKTGILIRNSNALATAIISLLLNRKKLNRLQSNCVGWVQQNFMREKIVAQWIQLIGEVLSNENNRPLQFPVKNLNAKLFAKELVRIKNKYTL